MDSPAAAAQPPGPGGFLAAARAFDEFANQLQADARRAAVRFGAIGCSCPPWWSWDERTPPQVSCSLHGVIVITPDGEVIA